MRQVTNDELLRIFYVAVSRSYFIELQKMLPKGIADNLELEMDKVNMEILITSSDKITEIFHYLDQGTGLWGPKRTKYVIEPVNKTVLRFKLNGENVFSKRVVHPGIKSRHYIKKLISNSSVHDVFEKEVHNGFVRVLDLKNFLK